MFQAAGRVAGLILKIQRDARRTRQLDLDQMRIRRAVDIGFDQMDGMGDPFAQR